MAQAYEVAQYIDRVMRRINTELHERIPAIDKEGVGPLGTMILMALANIEPAPVQQLVQYMERDKSQMTRAIKSLESKHLITRQSSREDARVDLLRLTDKGQNFVREIRKIMSDVMNKILSPLSAKEQMLLIELLEKFK